MTEEQQEIVHSVDVAMPVGEVYNQWTQFEDFTHFMRGVESVQQRDDTHTTWRIQVAGKELSFDAEITEQIPDKRIAWKSTDGRKHAGVVTFHRLDEDACRVTAQLTYEPATFGEKLAGWLGVVDHRVKGDMTRFKGFIESKGAATGGYRGKVEAPPES